MKWEKNNINNEEIVYFTIFLNSEFANKKWKVKKSQYIIKDYLNELFERNLLDNYPIPPLLNTNETYLNSYLLILDNYFHLLLEKEHILNSKLTIDFFELNNLIDNIDSYLPIKKIDFLPSSQEFNNIIDFFIKDSLLFIAANKDNISFFSSFFYNAPKYSSELIICNLYYNDKFEYEIKIIKRVKIEKRITKLKFISNNDYSVIFISFEDGSINIYNLYSNLNIEFIGNIKIHNKKIIDFGIDKNSGYVYSIGENEKNITISEFNYQTIISKIQVSFYPDLFYFDYLNHKIILSDKEGSLYIYQIVNLINLILLQAIYSENKIKINNINLIKERNFIFTSSENKIIFYDFSEKENFQFSLKKRLEIKSLDKESIISNIEFRSLKSEIIISTNKGNIEIWSHNKNYPNLKIKTQFKFISKMKYNKERNKLIILGDNKYFSIYELSNFYFSDLIREDKNKNDFSIIENLTQNKDNITLLKEALSRLSFGTISTSEETKNDSLSNNYSMIFNSEDKNYFNDDFSSLDGWELYDIQENNNDDYDYFKTNSCKF